MVVGESSQPHVKDTALTFQCSILTSTNYTIWKMRMEVLLGIHEVALEEWRRGKLETDRVKEARLQTLIIDFENLKMSDNDSIDAYAAKLLGIASKSATLGEVMSKHKLVKKFLTSLPRRFVRIVAAFEQVLDLKTTGTEYSNGNNDSIGGRGRGSYSRGLDESSQRTGPADNSQNQGQRNSSKNREDNEQKGKQHEKCDLSHIQCYRCDQYGHFVSKCHERNRNHEVNLNEAQEKGVYHEEGSYSYFSELNENITGRVRFGDGSCVSIKGKGSILFQGKNREQKLLKDVYYIPALRSDVISLGQATISGYDISIRGEFLTMRDSWGGLLIKVPRNENRLYKAQLKVGKENINEVGQESGTFIVLCNDIQEDGTNQVVDEEANPHSNLVTFHETNPESEKDSSRRDYMPNPLVRLVTIRLLITLAVGKGWKIHHLDVKTAFQNGNRKKLDGIEVSQGKDRMEIKQERYAKRILKEAGMKDCNATLCPMEPELKLSKAENEPKVEATQYQKWWVAHVTSCTTSFGIKYNRSNDMKLVGYSDSSDNVDIDNGRSTTGHVFYLGTLPITWCSQKQTTVALSSYEAEFMAATLAACQAIWLRGLLAEVTGLKRQKVIVEHVSGENQRADPLTKALARIRFKEMRSLLGVQELPSSTQKFRG
ncbi:uncharacterized mitochondrial protein-like protein [Tanacetum coccineum]